MRIFNLPALAFIALFILVRCGNREHQASIRPETHISKADSLSMLVLQTFSLPFSRDMKFDSNSLLFYCSRAYDTSSLIQIEKKSNLIRGILLSGPARISSFSDRL